MTYHVEYTLQRNGEVKSIDVSAKSKALAYAQATYESIPKVEGTMPYSSWVTSVTYQNGNYRTFNTCEGNPY